MTLGIITINYNRPRVLKLWCAQIKRLREQTETFIPAVVVSEETDKPICDAYHVHHITQKNKPVTAKWNRTFKYMQSLGVDSVMIIGSDDIISTGFYLNSLKEAEWGFDLISPQSVYFYAGDGPYKGQMVHLVSKQVFGTGRTVSKYVLDQCDWTLWTQERNWGMDAIALKTIKKYERTRTRIDGMIVDVKTRVNLNSYRIWGKRLPRANPQEFYYILSAEELKILKTL